MIHFSNSPEVVHDNSGRLERGILPKDGSGPLNLSAALCEIACGVQFVVYVAATVVALLSSFYAMSICLFQADILVALVSGSIRIIIIILDAGNSGENQS